MLARCIFACLVLLSAFAHGASLSISSAETRITFFGPTAADTNVRIQPVALGDFDTFNYNGASPGDPRGDGMVFYDFQPFKDAFQLFVQVKHQTRDEPDGFGGSASFELHFTSDVPLKYTFEAGLIAPPASFFVVSPPNTASAVFAGDDTWVGSIPQTTNSEGEVEFGLFIREGIIPAGVETLVTVDAVTFASRGGFPPESDGFLKFNVEPVPIPLPPLLLPGALCLLLAARKSSLFSPRACSRR
jgi:hypothetical protein